MHRKRSRLNTAIRRRLAALPAPARTRLAGLAIVAALLFAAQSSRTSRAGRHALDIPVLRQL